MPYYQWTGIDIEGHIKRGKQLATSSDILEKTLLKQGISLMQVYPAKKMPWHRWYQADMLDFFRNLGSLLHAGIFTTDALAILLKQAQRESVTTIIEQLHADVCSGIALSSALEKSSCFDQLTLAMIRSGEESGNLARALEVLCEHIEFKQEFYRRLRSAATMPIITLLFFIGIATVIVAVILPKFATLFLEHGQQLPWMTQHILAFNTFMQKYFVACMVYGMGFFFIGRWLKKTYFTTNTWMLSLPFISTVIIYTSMTYFLKALTVLLRGGVPLVPALTIAQHSVTQNTIRDYLSVVIDRVDKGKSLSDALKNHENNFFSEDCIAMITVSEEAGNVTAMIEHCAKVYEKKVIRLLDICATLFQPILMVLLGVMIAFLIFAVYMPVFELSNAVSWV